MTHRRISVITNQYAKRKVLVRIVGRRQIVYIFRQLTEIISQLQQEAPVLNYWRRIEKYSSCLSNSPAPPMSMLMMGHCRSCEIISTKMTLRLGIETLPVNIEIGGGGGICLNILMKPQFLVAKLFPSTVADDTPRSSKQLREDMFFIFSFSNDYSFVQCMQRNI